MALECNWQGQELLNPPSGEGWHTGAEWIDPGVLMRRVNFAARILGDTSIPGVQSIIKKILIQGNLSPEATVSACLDIMGPLEVSESTYSELMVLAEQGGSLDCSTDGALRNSIQKVSKILTLIAASRDYQFA